jgi:hypothetical protein
MLKLKNAIVFLEQMLVSLFPTVQLTQPQFSENQRRLLFVQSPSPIQQLPLFAG